VAVDGPRNLAGVTAQALNKRANIKLTPVPYPNINNGVQDVLGGRVEIGVFSVSVVETHIKSGGMKALAVAGNKRVAALPDTPAAGELLPGFDFSGWFMVMAPAGTLEHIVKAANAAFDAALKDPKVAGMAPRLGFEVDAAGAGTPAQAKAFLAEQVALWGRTTKDLGIEPQ
jgi:tripartite-type tricarboxylate transporter receptor subunit TctC